MITTLLCILPYLNLLVEQGQEERALEINALLDKYPLKTSLGVQTFYSARLDELGKILPPEVVAKAEARGRARDLGETAAEILAELEKDVRD
jgi:hypothetical protein